MVILLPMKAAWPEPLNCTMVLSGLRYRNAPQENYMLAWLSATWPILHGS
jgi:hypothetical protein